MVVGGGWWGSRHWYVLTSVVLCIEYYYICADPYPVNTYRELKMNRKYWTRHIMNYHGTESPWHSHTCILFSAHSIYLLSFLSPVLLLSSGCGGSPISIMTADEQDDVCNQL